MTDLRVAELSTRGAQHHLYSIAHLPHVSDQSRLANPHCASKAKYAKNTILPLSPVSIFKGFQWGQYWVNIS